MGERYARLQTSMSSCRNWLIAWWGLNGSPVWSIACMITASLRAKTTAARLKPSRSLSTKAQPRRQLVSPDRFRMTVGCDRGGYSDRIAVRCYRISSTKPELSNRPFRHANAAHLPRSISWSFATRRRNSSLEENLVFRYASTRSLASHGPTICAPMHKTFTSSCSTHWRAE